MLLFLIMHVSNCVMEAMPFQLLIFVMLKFENVDETGSEKDHSLFLCLI